MTMTLVSCDGCHRKYAPDDLQVTTDPDSGETLHLCLSCDPPSPPKRGRRKKMDGEATQSTLGPSRTVTLRLPLKLLHKIERLALGLYQPVPVVVRAALAEYVERHRPKRGAVSGLSIVWPTTATSDATVSDSVIQSESPVTPTT